MIIKHGKKIIAGAKVKASSFFRPTVMSVAMAKAGIIPAPHLVLDLNETGRLRDFHDRKNQRLSAFVAF